MFFNVLAWVFMILTGIAVPFLFIFSVKPYWHILSDQGKWSLVGVILRKLLVPIIVFIICLCWVLTH
jgi:hypothetical protein